MTPPVKRPPGEMLRLQKEAVGALVGSLFREERRILKVVNK